MSKKMKFTEIPLTAFDDLQTNAGVVAKRFDPDTGTLNREDIICATSGGVHIKAKPNFIDLTDGIDNAPANMKEFKSIDGWDCGMEFTSLGVTKDTLKTSMGAADVDGKVVVPRSNVEDDDFADIWWVGDKSNGGWVAAKLMNALSDNGLDLQTNDKGRGELSVSLAGHYSNQNIDEVPLKVYVGDPEPEATAEAQE